MSRRGDKISNKGKRGSRRAATERNQSSKPRRSRPARRASKAKSEPTVMGTWIKRIAIGGTLAVLVGLVALLIAVGTAVSNLPSFYQLKTTQNAQTILVRARDGSEIVEIGPSFGEWLDHDEIPQTMKDAMIAVEDKRYYSHFGIDPIRLTGAIVEGMTGDDRIGGTSTISQQLARNLFLTNNRSLDRKAREAILAMALEWKFSKAQILELYLNKVYFGGGAYGIDSASRTFFSHPAETLSTAEAAIIAGLVKSPSNYSPTADIDAAVGRARVVLGLMEEQGYITSAEASVDVDAVNLKKSQGTNSVRYFTDWALPQLDILLPETYESLEVWTTIDVDMQKAATEAIRKNTPGDTQGALVSLDRDGAILALVGGKDYVESNYNRATNAMRQPGSSWKLFVYLAALERGWTPDDRIVDEPVTIDGWSPRNSNGRNLGETNLRTAFALSINTVAAKLGSETSFGAVASMARRFGISSQISAYPSMVLGSNEVRVIEMVQAFAAIQAKGASVAPYGITRVTTASGEEIYRHEPPRQSQLIPDYVAAGMTDMLQTAVNTGTARAAQIGRPVAGKTGTTNSNKDGWFVGFSSGITTGVWMGRDDAKAVRGLQGGRAPARAFADFMVKAVADRPVEEFDTEVNLPGWQLEPDEDVLFGDPDEYYYIDEQGNLIEPGGPRLVPGDIPLGPDGMPIPRDGVQPAAPDDFLDRATGQSEPQNFNEAFPDVRRGSDPPQPPMPRTIRPSEPQREQQPPPPPQ
ncbi:PBP1A family penicillin-binding protein [Altererythrobacter sp. JGD-16]|uniref:PBP1A family penicillin-binding protein n=2 Tax=Altererythrobacter lutimaris TaxID=2743979 RepID=A0A850HCV6_9SPHN|nr:PBP1A family penicillin-binding protein [Altererythrobacter lutimaris]